MWHAVGAARNIAGLEWVHILLTLDLLDAYYSLMARLMRQPWRSRNISDGVDSRLSRLKPLIRFDMTAVDLHLGPFKPNVLDIPDNSDRENDSIHSNGFALPALLDARRDAIGGLVQSLNLGACDNFHAVLFKGLLGESGNFFVFDRQDAIHDLNHRHFNAKIAIKTRKLDPDRARSNN